jgi:hypothetical protein
MDWRPDEDVGRPPDDDGRAWASPLGIEFLPSFPLPSKPAVAIAPGVDVEARASVGRSGVAGMAIPPLALVASLALFALSLVPVGGASGTFESADASAWASCFAGDSARVFGFDMCV